MEVVVVKEHEKIQKQKDVDVSSISDLIQKEVHRYMKGKGTAVEDTPVNTSHFADFTVPLNDFNIHIYVNSLDWIIDSGALSSSNQFIPSFYRLVIAFFIIVYELICLI